MHGLDLQATLCYHSRVVLGKVSACLDEAAVVIFPKLTAIEMPNPSQNSERAPNNRSMKAPRHSKQTLTQFGSSCAQPQVANTFRIVLQSAAQQRREGELLLPGALLSDVAKNACFREILDLQWELQYDWGKLGLAEYSGINHKALLRPWIT